MYTKFTNLVAIVLVSFLCILTLCVGWLILGWVLIGIKSVWTMLLGGML